MPMDCLPWCTSAEGAGVNNLPPGERSSCDGKGGGLIDLRSLSLDDRELCECVLCDSARDGRAGRCPSLRARNSAAGPTRANRIGERDRVEEAFR